MFIFGPFACSGLRALSRVTPLFHAAIGFRSAEFFHINPNGMVSHAAQTNRATCFVSEVQSHSCDCLRPGSENWGYPLP